MGGNRTYGTWSQLILKGRREQSLVFHLTKGIKLAHIYDNNKHSLTIMLL